MDAREIASTIVGGAVHAYLLTSPEDQSTADNFIVGAAGGALGGMLMTTYLPQWGTLGAIASGVIGMLAFDYFLFRM